MQSAAYVIILIFLISEQKRSLLQNLVVLLVQLSMYFEISIYECLAFIFVINVYIFDSFNTSYLKNKLTNLEIH